MEIRYPPRLWSTAIPEVEREAVSSIGVNLSGLRACVQEFDSALHLHRHAASLWQPLPDTQGIDNPRKISALLDKRDAHNQSLTHWYMFAARAGAISIYSFQRIRQAIDIQIKQAPTVEALLDYDARRAANRLFDATFPNFGDVRIAAAHPGELFRFPENVLKAGVHTSEIEGIVMEPGSGALAIGEALNGSRYTTTVNGTVASYELSNTVRDTFLKVLTLFYSVFQAASDKTHEMLLEGAPIIPSQGS